MASDVSSEPLAAAAEPTKPSPPSSDLAVAVNTDHDAIHRITTLKKTLEDLTQSPVEYERLLSTLKELQSMHELINAQLLAQTQIGLLVNKLSRSTSTSSSSSSSSSSTPSSADSSAAAVRELAKAIIAQWKDKVKAKPSTPSVSASSSNAATAHPTANGATHSTIPPNSPVLPPSVSSSSTSSASSSSTPPRPSSVSKASSSPPPTLPSPPSSSLKRKPEETVKAPSSSSSKPSAKDDSKQPTAADPKKQKSVPSPVSTSTPSASPVLTSPPSTPSGSTGGGYVLGRTGDGTRNKIQQLLFEALGGHGGEWEVELAVRMERSMWSMYGDTSSAYKVKYRELAMNLKDPLNPDINDALLCGAWSPEQVVGMSVKELASQSLKAQREAEAKWARDEARSDLGKLNGLTDMFRCGKCRERKCTYYQMQTRSADEPMTVFVRCTVCGNRWKM